MNDMSWKLPAVPAGPDEDASDAPRSEIKRGAVIGGLFFLALLGGAAMVPMDAGAYAEGVVAVSGNRQAVQHREGGIVTRLNVREGQMVKRGDVLIQISASDIVASERALTAEVIALLAQRQRLLAEHGGLSSVSEPEEFGSLPDGDRKFAEDALEGQRMLFRARRQAMAAERGVLSQRTRQQAEQIGGFQHQIRSNQEQRRLIAAELEGLRELVSQGFVSINRIRALERTQAELEGSHGAYQADIARTSEAIGEARLQVMSMERQWLEEVSTQLREVQLRLDEIRPKQIAAREQLARSLVRAPAAGRVVGLNVFTEGGVIAPGATVMEIVPQDKRLLIDAKVSPTDADDLSVGMTTQIRFPALQERNIPVLHGKIANVSADSLEDERTGARFFRIQVAVPPEELATLRKVRADGALRAGLPAQVIIPLRKRTALTYLVEPLTQTLWRAGREH